MRIYSYIHQLRVNPNPKPSPCRRQWGYIGLTLTRFDGPIHICIFAGINGVGLLALDPPRRRADRDRRTTGLRGLFLPRPPGIYIYIYIHTYIPIYVYISVYLDIYLDMDIKIFQLTIRIRGPLLPRPRPPGIYIERDRETYTYIYKYIYKCVFRHLFRYRYGCRYRYRNIIMSTYDSHTRPLLASASWYIYIYIYIYIYVCIYIYICSFRYVFRYRYGCRI